VVRSWYSTRAFAGTVVSHARVAEFSSTFTMRKFLISGIEAFVLKV
jgi:hypothetical protein